MLLIPILDMKVKLKKNQKLKRNLWASKITSLEQLYLKLKNTPGVTGFIGSSGKGAKPTPLLPQEIDKILSSMGMSRIDVDNDLAVGNKVNIVDGPFKGMTGTIDSIDTENNRLNVLIDLFGQETPVEVELFQVNKA